MRKIHVTIIAPYEGLAETFKRIQNEFEHLDMTIHIADLQQSLPLLTTEVQAQTDIFISRGGTAKVIRTRTEKPVVEVPISGFDILRMILLIQAEREQTEIIAFENISLSFTKVTELIETDIPITAVMKEEEVEPAIIAAKAAGRKMIVGDAITTSLANKHGLEGILITSGEESVRTALEQADLLGRKMNDSKQQHQYFRSAFFQSDQFQLLADGTGHVFAISDKLQENETLLKAATSQLHSLIQNKTHAFFTEAGGNNVCFAVKNIGTEKAPTWLLTATALHQSLPKGATVFEVPHLSVPLVLGANDSLSRDYEAATGKHSVVLIGKNGSGEQALAKGLLPKLAITCRAKDLLNVPDFEANGLSLFITHAEELSTTQWRQLEGTVLKTAPYVVHSEKPLSFLNDMPTVWMPPLCERKSEWPGFIRRLIAEANQLYGKQIIGYRGSIHPAIMGNLNWLKEFIFAKVVATSQPYIDFSDSWSEKGFARIDLEQTLEEMEKTLIKHVLEEEGYNQSKTAERLQINRTTLWRKLK